jgi:hypothetical protein
LIRRFKPERSPEHFRRIREAYDQVRAQIAWQAYRGNGDDEADTSDQEAAETAAHSGANAQRSRLQSDPLDDAWRLACAGQTLAAYRQLSQPGTRAHQPTRRYAMLYWLLVTDGQLDASRAPLDWLIAGLNEHGYCDLLGQLLHGELSLRPRQALAPSFSKLFKPGRAVLPLKNLYGWRWSALTGRTDNLQVLLSDLKRATERLGEYSPDCTSTVIEGLRHLAWLKERSEDGNQEFARYREMLQHIDVYHDCGWELDRLELQEEVARDCRAWANLDDPPRPLLRAIEVYCRRGVRAARRPLLFWLRGLLQQPAQALQFCTGLADNNPPLWGQVVQIVDEAAPYEEWLEDEELTTLEPAVFTFFDRVSRTSFDDLRLAILLFCIREMISPQVLARVLERQAETIRGTIVEMAETITGDRPLRLLYTGYRMCAEPPPEQVISATMV